MGCDSFCSASPFTISSSYPFHTPHTPSALEQKQKKHPISIWWLEVTRGYINRLIPQYLGNLPAIVKLNTTCLIGEDREWKISAGKGKKKKTTKFEVHRCSLDYMSPCRSVIHLYRLFGRKCYCVNWSARSHFSLSSSPFLFQYMLLGHNQVLCCVSVVSCISIQQCISVPDIPLDSTYLEIPVYYKHIFNLQLEKTNIYFSSL